VNYESTEVVTLVHLGILFGWDLHLIPTVGYARAFVCHDEWVEIAFDHESQLKDTVEELQRGGLVISVPEQTH
jgi:hypothetical protein